MAGLAFTWDSSEALHLPQLHLYRYGMGYVIAICAQQYVVNTHGTISSYALAEASFCTCFAAAAAAIIYNYINNQQQQRFSSSVADLFHQDKQYINIVISITMLNFSESCYDWNGRKTYIDCQLYNTLSYILIDINIKYK